MDDCLFCKIVSGKIPSDRVFEDEEVYAFRDINPQAPTHVLIIPKRHIPSAAALTGDDAAVCGRLVVVAARIAQECGMADRGFRLVLNSGEDGGQSVGHLHLHLLGGRKLGWPPG
ncbi:MAG: histidine triad nucleotide-binding protein [Firmicutes bacterium]|nr:histidine triad nucleotide-binding protein [Bacillota bacterium]